MPITINGSGTITGVAVGGLPDAVVDADMLAANAVTGTKIGSTGTILSYTQVESETDTDLGSSTSAAWADAPSPFNNLQITPLQAGSKIKVILNICFYQDQGDLDAGITFSHKVGSGSFTRQGPESSSDDKGLYNIYFNSPGGASDYTWPVHIDYIHTPSSYSVGDTLTYKFEYKTSKDDCHWNGIRTRLGYARLEEVNA